MVSLKDVAREAGVSISTASYAMNHMDNKVNAVTKERVLKIAEKMGYHPNGTARDLKRRKTETVGMFLGEMSGPLYGEIIKGIQEVLAANNYDLIICNTHSGRVMSAQKFLREKRVDGAIVFSTDIEDDIIKEISETTMPVVVLDRELKGDRIYNVLIDNEKGACDAVSFLIRNGHEKIYYISGPENSYDSTKRFEGYRRAFEINGKTLNKRWCIQGAFTEQSGIEAARKIIQSADLPDAIFAANDEMAVGMVQYFQENGLKIPDDISIVGFDDIQLSSYTTPKLTTVSRPKFELGVLSAHTMLKVINGENASRRLVLSCELIMRESCRNLIESK